jgi:hypothetical protein
VSSTTGGTTVTSASPISVTTYSSQTNYTLTFSTSNTTTGSCTITFANTTTPTGYTAPTSATFTGTW